MKPYQSKPEEQLAFVLNLDSHWFTIRGFPNGLLVQPQQLLAAARMVGPAYLGALLDEAETEGYSVFVVRVAEGSRAAFQSSPADECAATLPHVSVAGGGGASSATSSANLGLKPQQASGSAFGMDTGGGAAQADEDADLQAALRASLADADLNSSSGESPSTSANPFASSLAAGQRRSRRAASGEDDDNEDGEETDAHVDAIAPSRRRARPMGGPSTATAASTGAAAGGSRTWDSNPLRRSGARHASGSRAETAIAVDDDDSFPSGDAQQDEDDFEEIHTSAPRSPFLNPVLAQAAAAAAAAAGGGGGSGTASDEDFHSVSSGDAEEGWAGLGESVTGPVQDRTYDDEDAELQAALAASMRDTGGAPLEADESTLMAAQMREWNRGESNSPPPADVERIARMRAEARQKEREEREMRERLERGEVIEEPAATQGKSATDGQVDGEDDEDDEDDAPQPSAEEMRKARLARFGA
ncbi:hypothetical protein L7F22_036892 [Adiantum nelumboides]|nr:hypothetical protein [Adiantum nelumboides]